MPRAWFEPTIPVFERLKTVRDLDRKATGTGLELIYAVKWHPYYFVRKTWRDEASWNN
jgi:hypothetical protein